MIQLLTGVKSSKRTYYSELKATISQLQKKNMQLEIISDVMKSMKVDMSIEDILKNVLAKLKKIIQFDRLSISLYQNDTLTLTNVLPTDLHFLEEGATIPRENSLFWKVVDSKHVVYHSISNTNKSESFVENEALEKLNLKSLLLLPLLWEKSSDRCT